MKKQIILLNGSSSSGKSTLAAALQTQISKKRGENTKWFPSTIS